MGLELFDQIRKWATERGIYKSGDLKTQHLKLSEEVGELAKAINTENDEEITDGIGDCIVVLTNLAALHGESVEDCILHAWSQIRNRKGKMVNGTFVKDS